MAKYPLVWRARRSLRNTVIATGKHIPFVHASTRQTLTFVRGRRYERMASKIPVDPKVVVFESYTGRNYSCSPRALYLAMANDPAYDDYTLVWAFKAGVVEALHNRGGLDIRGFQDVHVGRPFDGDVDELFGTQALDELRRAVIVSWSSKEYYRWYARAGLWISNSRIPSHLCPREGQTYLQTWHGTPLKRLGHDIPLSASSNATYTFDEIRRTYTREGERFTYLISPSTFATQKFRTAFDLATMGKADCIIEEGYPRNDALKTFSADDIVRIRERLKIPEGKKVALYAPTWRDNEHESGMGYVHSVAVDFENLKRELGDEFVILFRAHYLIANSFDFEHYDGFVRDVSKVSDINDLYLAADVLITDYSSVFFDYANLDRPILFYMYDLDTYAEEIRGFYLDLEELPGPVLRTEAELLEALKSLPQIAQQTARKRTVFRERFNYLDDGHVSERVLAHLLSNKER